MFPSGAEEPASGSDDVSRLALFTSPTKTFESSYACRYKCMSIEYVHLLKPRPTGTPDFPPYVGGGGREEGVFERHVSRVSSSFAVCISCYFWKQMFFFSRSVKYQLLISS